MLVNGWRRGARAVALGAAFGAGALGGLAIEGARARPVVAASRARDGAVVAALSGRAGPTGGVLPGLDAIVTRLDPAGGRAWRRVCEGVAAMSEPAVAVAPTGDVALALTFQGSVDCGAGPVEAVGGPSDFDALVVRFTAAGGVAWSRHVGGRGPQALASVAFDPWGSVVVAGSFAGAVDLGGPPLVAASDLDVLAAKLDPDGALVWQRRFGLSGRNFGVDVAASSTGSILLLAQGASDIDFGPGRLSASGAATTFVAGLDHRGRALWSRAFAGTGDVLAGRLLPLDDGGVLVVGRFEGVADFGAGPGEGVAAGSPFLVRLTSSGDPAPGAWSGAARLILP